MTLATQTWTQSAKFIKVITAAQQDVVQFIKESLDTYNTDWEVAGWSGAGPTQWLLIKRKGTEDNQRLCIFGGSVSAANDAALDGWTALTGSIYAYVTLDRPLTTVDGAYTAGDPFVSTPENYKLKGRAINIFAPSAGAAVLNIYSTPDILHLNIQSSGASGCTSVIFGKCVQYTDDADNVALFLTQSAVSNAPSSDTTAWFLPGCVDSVNTVSAAVRTGGTWYSVGRLWSSLSSNKFLINSALGGVLHDVSLCQRIKGSALAWEYVGRMRQIRYGPQTVDRSRIYSGDSLVAYHSCPPNSGAIQTGIYLDNVA